MNKLRFENDEKRFEVRGNTEALFGLLRENAELRREVEELRVYRALAYRDPLTGLGNRRAFQERLSEELARTLRREGSCFSVVAIDLDELKRVNDTRGHLAGDQALRQVAEFLRLNLRDHDVCCRTGGDEFMLLLPDAGEDGCRQLMERLRLEFALLGESETMGIGLSLGGATWCKDSDTTDLLRQADEAMYEDKRRRKGQTR